VDRVDSGELVQKEMGGQLGLGMTAPKRMRDEGGDAELQSGTGGMVGTGTTKNKEGVKAEERSDLILIPRSRGKGQCLLWKDQSRVCQAERRQ
jgi:hypothetical protein